MAMCYVIVKNGLYDKEFVTNWSIGFDEFKKRLMGEEDGIARTPQWASKISGVPAETIERIALEFAKAEPKAPSPGPVWLRCPMACTLQLLCRRLTDCAEPSMRPVVHLCRSSES